MGSLEVYKNLQLDLGYDVEFQQSDSLQTIQTEKEYAFARRDVGNSWPGDTMWDYWTGAMRAVSNSARASMGRLYYPHGGNANPVKTVLALASLAQRQGATILTHHEVTGLAHFDDGTYQVVTPPTTFRASTLS